jgi:hypothetical protein
MWQDGYTPCDRKGILYATAQVYSMRRTGIACGRIGVIHMAGKVYYTSCGRTGILNVCGRTGILRVAGEVHSTCGRTGIFYEAVQVYTI